MTLQIKIEMDNAAFEGRNGLEAARILRRLAREVEQEDLDKDFEISLRDENGNRVGVAEVLP